MILVDFDISLAFHIFFNVLKASLAFPITLMSLSGPPMDEATRFVLHLTVRM